MWQKDCITRSAEKPARQVFQLITGHWTGGVLRTDGGHFRFAISARTNTGNARRRGQPFSAPARSRGCFPPRLSPDGRHQLCGRPSASRALVVRPRPMISGIRPPARTSSISTSVSARSWPAVRWSRGYALAFERVNVDYVAHVQVRHINFDRQRARIFPWCWKKIGAILPPRHRPPPLLVRHVRDIVAHKPQHRVGGGFT